MTNEEAIRVLHCPDTVGGLYSKKYGEALNMAMEALKRELCEDCISRQAALDTFGLSEKSRKYGGDHSGYDTIMLYEVQDALEALPSVTPQSKTRWIPVSERLPKVGEKVLCQCQANIYDVLKLTVDGWYHDENHCYMSGFVIAWMPLPEPYKAEGSGENADSN